MIKRILAASDFEGGSSFLWGPRQTGKSTLLRGLFPNARTYDLLSSREFRRLAADPGIFTEECRALAANGELVIVDEIVPASSCGVAATCSAGEPSATSLCR